MTTSQPSKPFKDSFLYSQLIISMVIALTNALIIMLLLEAPPIWGMVLTQPQNAILNTVFLSVLVAPLIGLFLLRPLHLKISGQQAAIENEAKENKQLFNALDSYALVSIADLSGRITYANHHFCEISGYSERELLEQDHSIVNPSYHDKDFMRTMWRTIDGGELWQGKVCDCNKNGLLYWADSIILPMLGHDGKPKRYISIRRDISLVKENESCRLILKQILDTSSEMIIVTDDHGCIRHVNPALCGYTGWREEQLVGQMPDVLSGPNADPQTLTEMQRCLQEGQAWKGRLLNQRKVNIADQAQTPDAGDYWVNISITPIHNNDGEFLGCVQIQDDITRLVHEEQARLLENADTAAHLAISKALQQILPLKQRVTQVLDILLGLKGLGRHCKGVIYIKDPNQDSLNLFVLQGEFNEEFMRCEQSIPYGEGLCGSVAVSRKLTVFDDCFCDLRHEAVFDGMQTHGHYVVPIVSADITLGVLFLYTNRYPTEAKSRLTMLQQVGDLLAVALLQEQAKLSA